MVKTPRIAPSMVAYTPQSTYVVAQTDTEELPFGDRVDEAIPPEIV
ncbi:MAG TPA: hypothetical protein VED43_06965 [Mycobacterium sp.]|nr:hypothetical protein [Mycobacterium sp.]